MRPLPRLPDFLKLWTGQAISQIGSHITSAGLPLTANLVLGAASLLPPLAHGSVAACCAVLLMAQVGDGAWPLTNICDLSLRQPSRPPVSWDA